MELIEVESQTLPIRQPLSARAANGDHLTGAGMDRLGRGPDELLHLGQCDPIEVRNLLRKLLRRPLRLVDHVPGEDLRIAAVPVDERPESVIEERLPSRRVANDVRSPTELNPAR